MSTVLNYATTSWTTAVDKYKCFMPPEFYCFFNHGLFTLSEVNFVPVVGRTNHSFSWPFPLPCLPSVLCRHALAFNLHLLLDTRHSRQENTYYYQRSSQRWGNPKGLKQRLAALRDFISWNSRVRNKMIQSNCLISVGPLFLERRTVTGGPHRWLIACLIDSRVTVSQMPFLLLFALTPFGQRGWSTRLPFVASSCRLLLLLPFQPPLSTIFTGSMSRHKVGSTERMLDGPWRTRWCLLKVLSPISCANLAETPLASQKPN